MIIFYLQFVINIFAKYAWTYMEGGHIHYITTGCVGQQIRKDKEDDVVRGIIKRVKNFSRRTHYLLKYVLANLFILVVYAAQATWYLYMFSFFQGRDQGFGIQQVLEWYNTPHKLRNDPLIKVFPRQLGCSLNTYGPSGTVQKLDLLCTTGSFNSINELAHLIGLCILILVPLLVSLNMCLTAWVLLRYPNSNTENKADRKYYRALKSMTYDQHLLFVLIRKNVSPRMWSKIMDEATDTIFSQYHANRSRPRIRANPNVLEY